MKDIVAITYDEIDSEILTKTLKDYGMVFVRLSKRQAKSFIKLYERNNIIENYKWHRPSWLIRKFHLLLGLMSLVNILIFNMKLVELDSLVITNKIRCTWEIQGNGDYVLIFS